jgi:hypothetical protein
LFAPIGTTGFPEAPTDGQSYARRGIDHSWQPVATGTGLPEAPIDGNEYVRRGSDASWQLAFTESQAVLLFAPIATVSFPEAPVDGQSYARDGSTHSWVAVYTQVEADQRYAPISTVSFPEAPGDGSVYARQGSTHSWQVAITQATGDQRYAPITTVSFPEAPADGQAYARVGQTHSWVVAGTGGGGSFPEAPTDGRIYGRDGQTTSWVAVLPLAGGTMTGPLILSGNPTTALQAATMQYVQSQITGATQFIGTINGTTGNCTFTNQSGFTNGPLPPAASAANQYVICDTAGTVPSGPIQGAVLQPGDWVISNGTEWTVINVAGQTITASQVGVAPPVMGQYNVQSALQSLATNAFPEAPNTGLIYGRNGQNSTWVPSLPLAGGTMTGPLILSADPTSTSPPQQAVTLNYINNLPPPAASVVTVTPPVIGFSNVQGALEALAAGGTEVTTVTVAGDLAGTVSGTPSGNTVTMAGDSTGSGSDMTGLATGLNFTVDVGGSGSAEGTTPIQASQVIVSPPVLGAIDAQTALTNINTNFANFLPLIGGALTGALTLSGNPTSMSPPLQAAPVGWVNTAITASLQWVGTFNGSNGAVFYNSTSPYIGGALVPPATAVYKYVLVTVSGTIPAGPYLVGEVVNVGDWIWSDGAQWNILSVEGVIRLASEIPVVPPVSGQTNVQAALEALLALASQYGILVLGDGSGSGSGAIAGATVTVSSDTSGSATDTTGTADGLSFSGDASGSGSQAGGTLDVASLTASGNVQAATFTNGSGQNIITGRQAVYLNSGAHSTTSTSSVMMGLALALTPATSGMVLITLNGTVSSSTVGGTVFFQVYHGTGTPPAAGASTTGTGVGVNMGAQISPSGTNTQNFITSTWPVQGLIVGTQYWFDVAIATGTSGATADLYATNFYVTEY